MPMNGIPVYYSQNKQDFAVDKQLDELRGGFFVDFGAHDGVEYSNTCFFERERGWTGICVEPSPVSFPSLQSNRNCTCLQCAVSDFDGDAEFLVAEGSWSTISRLEKEEPGRYRAVEDEYVKLRSGLFSRTTVPVRRAQAIFDEFKVSNIDYLSIDVEGQEMRVLNSIEWHRMVIHIISVECNDGNPRFANFLWPLGFQLVFRTNQDEIYVHS